MAGSDFDVKLKKEARTSLQVFKDQSLLRRKFGDDAVRLYNMIDSAKSASQIMQEIGMDEEKFIQVMEFMNNNAMVSVVAPPLGGISPSEADDEGGEPASEKEEGEARAGGNPSSIGDEPKDDTSEESEGEKEHSESGGGDEGGEEGEETGGRKKQGGKFDPELLSPLEKILFEKYGELGVQIYNLIDGEKTAEEILRQTGVSEAKLVEILEFMDEQGIIKLEKPAGKEEPPTSGDDEEKPGPESGEQDADNGKKSAEPPPREPRFKPMIEEEPEEKPFVVPPKPAEQPKQEEDRKKKDEDALEEGIIPVDVPEMAKLSLAQKASLYADLATRFGKNARELVNAVDGKRDFVDLALMAGVSFFDVDAIMAYFGQKGFIVFRQLARDEIKKKYGEDGFAIYKRFGRDGIMLYEMIGKEASLKDIILKSRLDPDRAIDIFIFIHKVLGLDIPLDKNVIYRQLGLKK